MFSLPISLPDGYTLKTSKNSVVKVGEVLAEKAFGKDVVVPLAKKFGISPKKVITILKKGPGDKVETGDVLAEKKGIINTKRAISQFKGIVLKLEEDTGNLYIRSQALEEIEVLKSPVDGKVTFCDNEKVVLETEKKTFSAVKSFGKEARAELIHFSKEKVEPEDIDKKIDRKIILAKTFDRAALSKAFGLGALGAIGLDVSDEDIDHFRQRELEALIFQVDNESFEELVKADGKQIYLNARNNIIVVL